MGSNQPFAHTGLRCSVAKRGPLPPVRRAYGRLVPAEATTPDDLYRLPLADFIPARDALAKSLRAAGDRNGAAAVKQLRKPMLAAWALDQAARQYPDEVARLLDAGAGHAPGRRHRPVGRRPPPPGCTGRSRWQEVARQRSAGGGQAGPAPGRVRSRGGDDDRAPPGRGRRRPPHRSRGRRRLRAPVGRRDTAPTSLGEDQDGGAVSVPLTNEVIGTPVPRLENFLSCRDLGSPEHCFFEVLAARKISLPKTPLF